MAWGGVGSYGHGVGGWNQCSMGHRIENESPPPHTNVLPICNSIYLLNGFCLENAFDSSSSSFFFNHFYYISFCCVCGHEPVVWLYRNSWAKRKFYELEYNQAVIYFQSVATSIHIVHFCFVSLSLSFLHSFLFCFVHRIPFSSHRVYRHRHIYSIGAPRGMPSPMAHAQIPNMTVILFRRENNGLFKRTGNIFANSSLIKCNNNRILFGFIELSVRWLWGLGLCLGLGWQRKCIFCSSVLLSFVVLSQCTLVAGLLVWANVWCWWWWMVMMMYEWTSICGDYVKEGNWSLSHELPAPGFIFIIYDGQSVRMRF